MDNVYRELPRSDDHIELDSGFSCAGRYDLATRRVPIFRTQVAEYNQCGW